MITEATAQLIKDWGVRFALVVVWVCALGGIASIALWVRGGRRP